MRKPITIALGLTLVALLLVDGALLLGEKIYHRRVPGVRLVYDIQSTSGPSGALAAEMAAALKHRIDPSGFHELVIRPAGTQQVEVLAPVDADIGDLKKLLHTGGVLSFYVAVEKTEESDTLVVAMLARLRPGGAGPATQPGDIMRWVGKSSFDDVPHLIERPYDERRYLLVYCTPDKSLTRDDPGRRWSVVRATPIRERGERTVMFELDDAGAKFFGDLTQDNVNRPIAIVLDDDVISVPIVRSRIERNGVINGGSGGFTEAEVRYLASTVNAGTLPARLAPSPAIEEPTIIELGFSPLVRWLLKVLAVVLAMISLGLGIALLVLRRGRSLAPANTP